MTKKIEKLQSKIAGKKGRKGFLHEKSRDAQRLHRGQVRAERLERIANARAKKDQPVLRRVDFIQRATADANGFVDSQTCHAVIQRYLARNDEELASIKSQRRAGRPSSTREDLLSSTMTLEDKEYDSGFWMPDVRDTECWRKLQDWTGDWASLNNVHFIRVMRNGTILPSSFPPNGVS